MENPAVKETSKAQPRTQAPPLVIAIQFDHSKLVAALINEQGRAVEEREVATPQRTTRAAAVEVAKMIVALAVSQSRARNHINAIGFSVAGLVDPATGRVSIPGLKGWTRVALRQMIEEELNGSGIDVRVPPDEKRARAKYGDSAFPAMVINSRAAAMAAGEAWVGAARGKNNVVYLSIGEDVEAGIIVKRRVIEGWDGGAKSVIGNLIKDDLAHLDDAAIIRAARGGDALALNSVNETCRWIGRGVANLVSILNPDAIVIGGQIGLTLKPYLDQIREEVARWAMPASARQCRIANAALGDKAALIGAARLAFDNK